MAWENSTRRSRLPPDWAKRRAATLKRARYQCQVQLAGCTGRATEADHINNDDDHDQLQAACAWCNSRKNIATRPRPVRVSTKRKPERHPGLR